MSTVTEASCSQLRLTRARLKAKRPSPRIIFVLGLLLACSGLISPPLSLICGIAFGFVFEHPFRSESASLSRLLLQISVVALGFGMNLGEVVHAGSSGFSYTALSIGAAILLGTVFGRLLRVGGKSSFLITAGTAICGGSAIAAIAPITAANEEEISVSMGTVFLLNSIALLIFPAIGHAVHLSQSQFGLWAALAIHDTSSVVGAAAKYGSQALAVGTTVKLVRALWIIPVSLLAALFMRKSNQGHATSARVKVPWFILLFCLAAVISSFAPRFSSVYAGISHIGRAGLTATLFLIGTSLSKRTLRQVGIRPFVQGLALWIVVASLSLVAILHHWISI